MSSMTGVATGTGTDMACAFATARLPPTHAHEHDDLTPMEERTRTLELAKYFEASHIVPPPSGLAAAGDANDEHVAAAPCTPAADTTLTALAQLGAFKLKCDRAFISLINTTHQFIIGEATQETSLLDNAIRAEDGLCLGVRALELSYGVCPQTIEAFTSPDRTISTPNVYADQSRYVIKDFTQDSHFKVRPYVEGWPHMRSYAEVPLTSASGYVVGSYCVVDTRPRDFEDPEIQVLASVAGTIMNHLELLKSQVEFHRVQRLVRGIGTYAAGYSGLQEHQTRLSLGSSTSNPLLPKPVNQTSSFPVRLARDEPDEPTARPAMSRVHTEDTIVSASDASIATSVGLGSFELPSGSTEPASKSDFPGESERQTNDTSVSDRPTGNDQPPGEATSTALSRASHLIRQSMDLGGVVFLKPHANADASTALRNVSGVNAEDSQSESSPCAVISKSVAGESPDASDFTLSHMALRRLFERYPFGHVFSYDNEGAVLQPPPGTTGQERRHPSRPDDKRTGSSVGVGEAEDAAELLAAAKGARSIAFTTLWDYRSDKWFAASIGWTTDPHRIFDISELDYLSAFGNSITAEISRLEVAAVSKAKSDFMSSISHEMRSPLHGILAGTELLRDTMKSNAEASMLDSIDACGSMLLDTIDHLLDYSKIINSKKRQNSSGSIESRTGENAVVDLSTLVHDVVDGVFLGSMAVKNTIGRETSEEPTTLKEIRQDKSESITARLTGDGDVVTIVDIDPSIDWRFKTEAAAWTRVVMNLFGNALKFTKKGQITVRLHLAQQSSTEGPTSQHVCVDVIDTGLGMDPDYLKSHLFTPFSQADDVSIGTGVGMSIVKRLVEELNGFIDVQSDVGLGTRVRVAVPLGETASPVSGTDGLLREEPFVYANGRHKEQVLHVQIPTSEVDTSTKFDDTGVGSNTRIFFANLASRGFGMRVVELAPPSRSQQHSETTSNSIFLHGSASGGSWTMRKPAHHDAAESDRKVVSIKQPFGPRTFATALDEMMAFAEADAGPVGEEDGGVEEKTTEEQEKEKEDGNVPSASPPRISPRPESRLSDDQNNAAELETERPNTHYIQPSHPPRSPETQNPSTPTSSISSATRTTSSTSTPPPAKPPHILLVDDNAVNLAVLSTMAKKSRYTFDTATDGRQAVRIFEKRFREREGRGSSWPVYDLIFMDLSMPVLDGVEAIREIRGIERGESTDEGGDASASEPEGSGANGDGVDGSGDGVDGGGGGGDGNDSDKDKKRTRIIALTALDDEVHRQRAFEAGVDGYVTKPVKMARARELVLGAECKE